MKRKCLAVGIILLFIGTAIIPSNGQNSERSSSASRGNWLYVGGSGPGNYSTIQDAIDNASDGDTVFVYAGMYHENVIVNKTITVTGENKNTTVIDGSGTGNVVLVCSDFVTISGFTIQDSGSYYLFDAGLSLHANYTNVFDNNVTNNNRFGIVIGIMDNNLYHHNNIHNNLVSKNYDTNIWIEESDYNNISNNVVFQDDTRDCICARYAHHCTIENNMILDSPYGISLFWGSNATVVHNTIQNCLIIGIGLSDQHQSIIGFNTIDNCTYLPWMGNGITMELTSSDNSIIGNSISNATCTGIWLYDAANNNIIERNTVKHCQYYGISLTEACNNNKIYHNNYFVNTPTNAYDSCDNLWDNGYPSGGNYWDDYTGIDANDDGIGDTPYSIPGGSNQDSYPLMNPLYNEPPLADFSWMPDKPNIHQSILFNASASHDPDGTIVSYEWDWNNDGVYEESHTSSTAIHSWATQGSYPVAVRVTDDDAATGAIAKTVTVNATVSFTIDITGGVGIKATIKNNGTLNATGIQWKYTLTGGLILLGKTRSGTIPSLAIGKSAIAKDSPVLGFGKATILLEVTCGEGVSVTQMKTGTIILFFIIGVT